MPQVRWRIVLGVALGLAFVAAVVVISRQSRQLEDLRRESEGDKRALRELREGLRQRDLQQTPVEAEHLNPPADQLPGIARRRGAIDQLHQELDSAHATIAQLQGQLNVSHEEREKALASVNETHRKNQESWQSQIDALKQQLDSAEAESQASRQRIADLEAEAARLKSASAETSARAADGARTLSDLQDAYRRRDLYLTSISRRYRDIASQFRAMSGMLDSSRDPNSSSFSGAALLRIQSEISLADDELRQLNDVNAQIRQLEKKLTQK